MALNEDDPSGVQTLSTSVAEIQKLADQILDRLGQRIRSGQMVIHFHEGRVQRVETNTVHRPTPRRTASLDHPAPAVGAFAHLRRRFAHAEGFRIATVLDGRRTAGESRFAMDRLLAPSQSLIA